MTVYCVTIKPTESVNRFHTTWHNVENNTVEHFEGSAVEITPEDTRRLWHWSRCQLGIGQKFFRFLDGEAHYFQQALTQAKQLGEKLQLHLHTCKETADWPFELLAKDDTFLLPHQLHLVRSVSDWALVEHNDKTKQKFFGGPGGDFTKKPPGRRRQKDRPLKLLFMACSAMDIEPELDFEREEEAIFHITEKLAIDMDVEDSGSLEGLRSQLEQEQYDVVHLSGHAGIDKSGRPYFIMEDETGLARRVFPGELWNEALIKNPPRLLFLSGCRTGEVPDSSDEPGNIAESSFARSLVEKYGVQTVLGWGRAVKDEQAIHAGKMIFHELSRGKSVLDAVQRARFELTKDFPTIDKPAWPLLRLFGSGVPLEPIVESGQRWQPKPQRMKHVYLKNSEVKVLSVGFVGRRRQLQTGLRALKHNPDKIGLLILGTGGLGKSCLAGKICERFPDFTLVVVHGRFNTITLGAALGDAFIASQDEKGQKILSLEIEMTDKLSHLCTTSFKEKNYLLLLDDFEQNLEGADRGEPGDLLPEAANLLNVLLRYLPHSGKMTQMLITSRYDLSLSEQNRDLIGEKLENVWLTGFREPEQLKKARELSSIYNYEEQSLVPQLMKAGCGNPRLMEWLDVLVGEMTEAKTGVLQLLAAVQDKKEEFIRQHVIRELLRQGGMEFQRFLQGGSIYRRPVLKSGMEKIAEKVGIEKWQKKLEQGLELSIMEYDQARGSYGVTPLLREELLVGLAERYVKTLHLGAFSYYRELGEINEEFDPLVVEEWVYHALGCGEEELASRKGGELVGYLVESLAFLEARRVGEWVLAGKKEKLARAADAFLLNVLGHTIGQMGDNRGATDYIEQALAIWKVVYGERHSDVAAALNNLGEAWRALRDNKKTIQYCEEALAIWKSVYGEICPQVATALNNLAGAWDDLGEKRKAIQYYEDALIIWKAVYGAIHPQVAKGLNNLGVTWIELGKYEKAIGYYEESLTILKGVYDEIHPDVAMALNNLGSAWEQLGENQKAIPYYEVALNIVKTVYGDQHHYVAATLNNLGGAWKALGKYKKALSYYEAALAIVKSEYKNPHPHIAATLNNIGDTWRASGEPKRAIGFIEKALTIWRLVYGEIYPHVAAALNNLGGAWYALSDYNKAIHYFEEALAIDEKVYGKEHPNVAGDLNNLGGTWSALGDYKKGIQYYEKALAILKTVYKNPHPHVAVSLNNLGCAWRALGEPEIAIKFYEEALTIRKAVYGEIHPQVATVLNNLGGTYLSLNQYQKARLFLEPAYAIFKKFFGDEHPNTKIVKNGLDACTGK